MLSAVVSLDQGLPPAPALIPTSLSKPLELGGVTYRVVEKHLDWTGALHLCESLNGTLATVKDPYQQAYLTLLINSLRRPAWIALYNYGVSLFTYIIQYVTIIHYQSDTSTTVFSKLREKDTELQLCLFLFSGTEFHLVRGRRCVIFKLERWGAQSDGWMWSHHHYWAVDYDPL